MKKALFTAAFTTFLLGTTVLVFAQTAPGQNTTQSDTAKVKGRMKRDQKKSVDGRYMLKGKQDKRVKKPSKPAINQ
jgi:hypothetical protein